MKLGGGGGGVDDGAGLEALFANLAVSADWTIGFLTAIGTGPDSIGPAAWIPAIVPDGAFDEDPAARARVGLLARLLGAVLETLRTSPEIICPEPDKPAREALDFCRGYVAGARMNETWGNDEEATKQLVPFETLANALENEAASGENGNATDAAATMTAERERLGTRVAGLHAYWKAKRQVVNAAPKVGRNDPCSCGSGKKHKKCCLAKAS